MSEVDEARALLADALNLAPEVVTGDVSLETCVAWDSLAHFRIVAAVEAKRGRPLAPEEILALRGFEDVVRFLVA